MVGSTTDYIAWLEESCPGQALFLTAPLVRQLGHEPPPAPAAELLADLEDFAAVRAELVRHLARWNLVLAGIACFDGESLELAAQLAFEFSLPYPSVASVRESNDKFRAKRRWAEKGVPCPQARLIDSAAGAFAFLQEVDGPCILKPVSASGSELVFRCSGKRECEKWTPLVQAGVAGEGASAAELAATLILAEEYIPGEEYSCDFAMVAGQARVLRLTRKLPAPRQPFGTIMAYALVDDAAAPFAQEELAQVLARGSLALGLERAVCMVDFIVGDQGLVLLEMTPRPGGDCLPQLLRRACQVDILALTLAFARQGSVARPTARGEGYAGLRLHARRSGELRKIESRALLQDERVRECQLLRQAGHRVVLPPEDYGSWYLGYAIFRLQPERGWAEQCAELGKLLLVEFA